MARDVPRSHHLLYAFVCAEEEHRTGSRADGPSAETSVNTFEPAGFNEAFGGL